MANLTRRTVLQAAAGAMAAGVAARAHAGEADPPKRFYLPENHKYTIVQSAELFKVRPFFLSSEYSMVDATIAPILWRLPHYEIELPPQAAPILKYAEMIFARPGFRRTLSVSEQEMRL